MNVFETLDRKAAQLVAALEVAEYELDYLNEIFQVTGENKLEERAKIYTNLSKLSQELLVTQAALEEYYVADHIEEIYKYF